MKSLADYYSRRQNLEGAVGALDREYRSEVADARLRSSINTRRETEELERHGVKMLPEPQGGDKLRDVIEHMTTRARAEAKVVGTRFNGAPLLVEPGDSPRDAEGRWLRQRGQEVPVAQRITNPAVAGAITYDDVRLTSQEEKRNTLFGAAEYLHDPADIERFCAGYLARGRDDEGCTEKTPSEWASLFRSNMTFALENAFARMGQSPEILAAWDRALPPQRGGTGSAEDGEP